MNNYNFSQDYTLFTPKRKGLYPIQETDWERLKFIAGNILSEKKIYCIISSICFGIFASSIFSVLSLYTLDNLPQWIIPTNIAILISSLILGIVLLYLDHQQKQIIKYSSQSIIYEMKSIEEQYEKISCDDPALKSPNTA
ncbi:MAG TPA: hypothetical protein P5295_17295 [Spirochaetota bacterium]|nr:hypothetical protein [Spirochaetota bacterium]